MPRQAFRERCTGENCVVFFSLPSIILWVSFTYLGLTYGLEFFNETRLDTNGPPGSDSWKAEKMIGASFPYKTTAYPFKLAVVIASKSAIRAPITAPAVADLTQRVLNATLHSCSTLQHWNGLCWWRSAEGLFVPRTTDTDADPADFASENATMIVFTNNAGFGGTGNHYELEAWDRLQQVIDSWLARHGSQYEVGVTHEQMLLYAAQKRAIKDFETGDMITLPIAWLLLAAACGPPAAISLLTLPITLLSAFYVLHQIASGGWFCKEAQCPGTPSVEFPGFFPAILVNMVIAVSLDYSLFILTRYQDESTSAAHRTTLSAIVATMRSAGRVVCISGLTLATTFYGLTFCSEPVTRSIGWGGAVTCILAILVHVTLLPALLFICAPCCGALRCRRLRGKRTSDLRTPLSETIEDDGGRPPREAAASDHALSGQSRPEMPPRSGASDSAAAPLSKSLWVRLACICRDHRKKVLLANVLLLVPFACLCSLASVSDDQAMLTPRHADALRTINRMPSLGLSPGVLNPVRLITYNRHVDTDPLGCSDDDVDVRQLVEGLDYKVLRQIPPDDITCKNLHRVTAGLICNEVLAPWLGRNGSSCGTPTLPIAQRLCKGTCPNFCSPDVPAAAQNRSVLVESLFAQTWSFRRALEEELGIPSRAIRDLTTMPRSNRSVYINAASARELFSQRSGAYARQFDRLVNFNRSFALMEVVLPRGQASDSALLRRIRKLAARHAESGFGFLVAGDIPSLLDAVDQVMSEAPAILAGTTSVVVFVIAGLAFRSLLIPLRLIVTILATLVLTGGSTVLAYQVVGQLDGIYWLVPIACGVLVIGLTIDYDVFLVSRCYELRQQGFSSEASIIRSMDSQSGTITTAGLIMTIAFSSLLLSQTTVLNQWGFMLVVASLYDTFVVRSLLVPSLMFCFVEANWWPGKMPRVCRDIDGLPLSMHIN